MKILQLCYENDIEKKLHSIIIHFRSFEAFNMYVYVGI